ncbi:MAG: DEAD/DEAH box helicase [Verrucomicrobiales bacterium]|nr:DEAD/DEAH box helicase [Verrucomicrobiales bacterium]
MSSGMRLDSLERHERPFLHLSPDGVLLWNANATESGMASLTETLKRDLAEGFSTGPGPGLLALAGKRAEGELPPSLSFWRRFVRRYLVALCQVPRLREDGWQGGPTEIDAATCQELLEAAPPEQGFEYLSAERLTGFWREINRAIGIRIAAEGGDAARALEEIHPVWRLVGRVTLHLAENKRSPEFPFAFLATYSHRIDSRSQVQYLPLSQALKESAASNDRAMLRTLLEPLQAVAEQSAWMRRLIESKEIFSVLAWTPAEAYQFLRESPVLEEAGLLLRLPDWWNARRPPRPRVTVVLDTGRKAASMGANAMLGFDVQVALGDQELTAAELAQILAADAPLVSLKGQWVEVDRDKLQQTLDHWRRAERANAGGLPFHLGMRLLAGLPMDGGGANLPEMEDAGDGGWVSMVAGGKFRELLAALRDPETLGEARAIPGLQATLRPYQMTGVSWLAFLSGLGFGACLADDMGLGKTLQVIAFLLLRRKRSGGAGRGVPSLLVVPASLLGNWKREIAKFAPDLSFVIAHRSEMEAASLTKLQSGTHPALQSATLIITTYTTLAKLTALQDTEFDVLALDEAQAIKNAGAGQTRTVKKLHAAFRLILTGTPVENRLDDLWSLFDFINPGLLGAAKVFAESARRMSRHPGGYGPLRRLVQPYILRRMKTDPDVAPDLPAKNEMTAFCSLTKRQATLYQRAVASLRQELAAVEGGIQRQGVVLATLMKLKQICNHPSLWSGDAAYAPEDSGKFDRLAEITAQIADRQEKMLVFTQFREMTGPLADFLTMLHGRPGLVLHGGTAVGKRGDLVEQFQASGGPPFFVISLKAGGTGLTLTAASHVVHFDRWWNPAVEDQATDRAFRIGQKKSVLVHKLVCEGTLEERIDELIQSKRRLASEILGAGDGAAKLLTEMNDEELLNFVRLDVSRLGV